MFLRVSCVSALCIVACGLASCSTHPLPDDVTRRSTFDIVQKLRCEAKTGLEAAIRSEDARLSEEALVNTYIGFDFTFDITENNKATGGTLEFSNLIPGGKFFLTLKGGADRSRQNSRFFRVIELLSELRDDPLLNGPNSPCSEDGQYANFVYPIAGTVGIDEIVLTYAKLRRIQKFRIAKDSGTIFSDTLTFTTILNAGISPKMELNTVTGPIKLTKANIDGSVERKDIHKVAIAMAPRKSVQDVSIVPYFGRNAPSAILPDDAGGVILELERLRNRDEDLRTLETFRLLE